MLVDARTTSPGFFFVEWRLNMGGRVLAISDVIAQIDAEILKLQQAKALLGGATTAVAVAAPAPAKKSGRGRPKGSKNSTKAVAAKVVETKAPAKTAKRKLSPEGRKAIAEAMKRRWAERRKQAAK